MAEEEIVTRKGMARRDGRRGRNNDKKGGDWTCPKCNNSNFAFRKSVIAVKQIGLEMARASLRENLTEVETISKKEVIGLVLNVTTRTLPSEINAIAVMLVDLVQEINLRPEVDVIKIVVLDPKEDPPHADGKVTWQR